MNVRIDWLSKLDWYQHCAAHVVCYVDFRLKHAFQKIQSIELYITGISWADFFFMSVINVADTLSEFQLIVIVRNKINDSIARYWFHLIILQLRWLKTSASMLLLFFCSHRSFRLNKWCHKCYNPYLDNQLTNKN